MPNGQTVVPELSIHQVTSVESVLTLLQRAAKNRAVAETLCNDRSSRSHRYTTHGPYLNSDVACSP